MSMKQDRVPARSVKQALEAAVHHHRGRRQDEFESVLNVEIRILQKNILCACAEVYGENFDT